MWRRRSRLRLLEAELAVARAERAALSRRLEAFEQLAAQVGGSLPDARPDHVTSGPAPAVPGSGAPAAAGIRTPGASSAGGPQQRGDGIQWHPAGPVPPVLLAAARELRPDDFPVRLSVDGQDLVAVVGGPGDPREWWTAIWQLSHYAPGGRRAET